MGPSVWNGSNPTDGLGRYFSNPTRVDQPNVAGSTVTFSSRVNASAGCGRNSTTAPSSRNCWVIPCMASYGV